MENRRSIRSALAGASLAALMLAAGGCGVGYYQDAKQMATRYTSGDLEAAYTTAERSGDRAERRDRLVWYLERGALRRTMGDFEASELAFNLADQLVEEYEWEPEVSVTAEAAATLTNLAALPYRGYAYDKIMLSTYRALNAIKMQDLETARVELNRAFERQRRAIERNQQRIQAAEEERREAEERQHVMAERPAELDELEAIEIHFADLYQAQGQYINPFTEFLQGLYLVYAGTDPSDYENGRHAFERVAAITGEHNSFVIEDLRRAEQRLSGGHSEPVTYIVFETGRAPSRDQIRIDIPVPLAGIDYVGAAFPRLVFHDNYEPYLLVECANGMRETRLLADMDTIIGLEFKNELPHVITRTIMIAVAQAAAHYGMHHATEGDTWANLAVRIGGVAYRAAQAQADRRTWLTLPKQFQYCSLPTPPDRTLVLQTPSTSPVQVPVEPGEVNVVYVKSIAAGRPLKVWQFALR